jgi:hypothetical protein
MAKNEETEKESFLWLQKRNEDRWNKDLQAQEI